jgi:3-oxoacyl-[acyl-carrier-protein] synthase-1
VNGSFNAARIARLICWEAISTVGESAAETALLLRAGISNVSLSRFVDESGSRIKLCSAPALPVELLGLQRAVVLASRALLNLVSKLRSATTRFDERKLYMALALPERFAAEGHALNSGGASFVQEFAALLPLELKNCEIEYFPFGRAAGALALQKTIDRADRGYIAICGGVDTQYDWEVLDALARADRLLTADNVDGLRPGEGAAFVVVDDGRTNYDVDIEVGIFAVGLAREPHPIGSEIPSQAMGLSAALETALRPLRSAGRRVNFWLVDNTHETYATQELQNIIARFGDVLGLQTELAMPSKELGDVGASAIPMWLTLGAEAWRRGYANDTVAIATASSDQGARGAVLFGCA